MSQYRTGTASAVQDSAVVSGVGTAWLANVSAGDGFVMAGTGVVYDIASVDSDTQITLTVPYQGADRSGAYAIQRDFTADGIPEMASGDIETPTIFTRAMRKIQSRFNLLTGVAANGAPTYGDTAAGIAGTSDTEFFWVPDAGGLTLYQNDNGTAVEQGDYPNSQTLAEAVDAMNGMEARFLALIGSLHPSFGETSLYADFKAQSFVLEVA
ncbi:MAG: hypothetical protein ACJAZ5_000160 [Alloalcanivorax venustensis]|jgi:hypothetical protein